MLNFIDCPSYIRTTQEDKEKEYHVEVAMVPWDQFHTLMAMVGSNNRQLIEVNTVLNDITRCDREGDLKNLDKAIARARKYLEDENVTYEKIGRLPTEKA